MNEENNITEQKSNTIVLGWGRFNPPTTGHEKLVNKIALVAKKNKADFAIYPTKTNDPKKNPLTFKEKVKFMKKLYPRHAANISTDPSIKTIIQAATQLNQKYNHLILVVGSDRINEFTSLLNKVNGKDYSYDSISVVSAGDRDPDAQDVTGMSASKMREAAANNDFKSFAQGVPIKRYAKAMFDAVRKGMKINERFEKDGIFDMIEDLSEADFGNPRFRKLLRFGLSEPSDLLVTQRAFSNFDSAQSQPPLRQRVFDVTDKAFEYFMEDDILYNRLLILLQRDKIFGEDFMDTEFELFLSENDTPVNYVAQFDHPDLCKKFIKEGKNAIDVNWISRTGKEVQFKANSIDESIALINRTQARFNRFDDDIRNGAEVDVEDRPKSIQESLHKKAAQSDIPYDILCKVYLRGIDAWEEECGIKESFNPEQWAYNRVNSFVSNGRSRRIDDKDLWEDHKRRSREKITNLDMEFQTRFLE